MEELLGQWSNISDHYAADSVYLQNNRNFKRFEDIPMNCGAAPTLAPVLNSSSSIYFYFFDFVDCYPYFVVFGFGSGCRLYFY